MPAHLKVTVLITCLSSCGMPKVPEAWHWKPPMEYISLIDWLKCHKILNMINVTVLVTVIRALSVVFFLAASLFLLHRTLNQTYKLDMIAQGFGVCV